MQTLYNKLKHYSIQDAIAFEEADRQFIALKNLWANIDYNPKKYYLALIIANALICYQLSGKGEDYWEEFSEYFSSLSPFGGKMSGGQIGGFLSEFIKLSKGNRRFVETKIKRLEKLRPFLKCFIDREEYYYENMIELRDDLAEVMNQNKVAKTIVFAVKMFSYGARNVFGKIVYFPSEICVPVDSRLTNIFEKYRENYTDINKFYFDLSQKLGIPELHLDAIIWNNSDL
ncbi:MAG: N-glycosylase/DNA lyase [Candidatus Gracilibacteria bacterium]|nr:N-glycosylase/DNA lyase [Candidatus Gracilibacteria bacterium]